LSRNAASLGPAYQVGHHALPDNLR
jgi:hypothetical protein